MPSYLTFIHALSALHAGTGQGSGVIDLPIARERATGLPYLPGSSLKGSLRSNCNKTIQISNNRTASAEQIFGSEETDGLSASAGTIQFTDQRLLLLPVRSLAGTFAWVTSPYILYRLRRDLLDVQILQKSMLLPAINYENQAVVITTSQQQTCQLYATDRTIYLEDLDLTATPSTQIDTWAQWLGEHIFPGDHTWQKFFRARFCLIHDNVMNFLLETATEITARIRLEEESKTVSAGALWYEEALPAESVLSGLGVITARPHLNGRNGQRELHGDEIGEVLEKIANTHLQLGGKSTVGRGQCRVRAFRGA
jgi:CRISPR-associated protein Cmr4